MAPRPSLDIKHIRTHAAEHRANCVARRYDPLAGYPERIAVLHEESVALEKEMAPLRRRAAELQRLLAGVSKESSDAAADGGRERKMTGEEEKMREAARDVKDQLSLLDSKLQAKRRELLALAEALPNRTSPLTPPPEEGQRVLRYINADDRISRPSRSHVPSHDAIAARLGLVDFAGAARSSGWGWYSLVGDGALLEQALVQYALTVARHRGWVPVAPPCMVYAHAAAGCGFRPRDVGGEEQIYRIAQQAAALSGSESDGRPEHVLAATAEIPLAATYAGTTLDARGLPLRRVGVSRCFRAEAGARGVATKGLYRVHEFTKVELFAWTAGDENAAAATDVFNEMVDLQSHILQSLGLHCRVLEMPASDLGASAYRKIDIEAWFPGRPRRQRQSTASIGDEDKDGDDDDGGWGEVTSASICTDYQTRRLNTRLRNDRKGGSDAKLGFPFTVNGTALAVPRVLACILETGWDEGRGTVRIPEPLRPWMDGREEIVATPGFVQNV